MKSAKLLLGLAAIAAVVGGWFLLRGSPMEVNSAKDAFVRQLQPAAEDLISKSILAKPRKVEWGSEPIMGMDEAAAPAVALLSPGRRQLRIVGQGGFNDGTRIILDGEYSRPDSRFTMVRLTLTFPPEPHKTIGNVPITAAYLAKNGINPALAHALLKGIGQGSTGSSSSTYQARAELGGKAFEATTAIYTGPQETALTVICSYIVNPDGSTKPL